MLESVNLALNPFDQHYIDRDLSRTGLTVTIITPGTGHFAVDKNLLRMTTERMTDHGICLDLVCLTKMPLHSVPLFSYVTKRPSKPLYEMNNAGVKTKPATPDLLYFDAHLSSAVDTELADCYCKFDLAHDYACSSQLFPNGSIPLFTQKRTTSLSGKIVSCRGARCTRFRCWVFSTTTSRRSRYLYSRSTMARAVGGNSCQVTSDVWCGMISTLRSSIPALRRS